MRERSLPVLFLLAVCGASATLTTSTSAQATQPTAEVTYRPEGALFWTPKVDYEVMVLTVSGPGGVESFEFRSGSAPAFELIKENGEGIADGSYTYELKTVPFVEPWIREAMTEARELGGEDELVKTL